MDDPNTNGARSVSNEAESRTPRADAARNRDQLLAGATRVFASAGTEPSMRAIAREAGVGIATLYRHFPTKESLVDAVYRSQVVRLTTGARELLDQLPPAAAMRRWMDLFGDWITPPPAGLFADMAHKHGVGLVDTSRSTFLVDARVHEGVLFRLARLRRQQPPRLVVKPETWRGLR